MLKDSGLFLVADLFVIVFLCDYLNIMYSTILCVLIYLILFLIFCIILQFLELIA